LNDLSEDFINRAIEQWRPRFTSVVGLTIVYRSFSPGCTAAKISFVFTKIPIVFLTK